MLTQNMQVSAGRTAAAETSRDQQRGSAAGGLMQTFPRSAPAGWEWRRGTEPRSRAVSGVEGVKCFGAAAGQQSLSASAETYGVLRVSRRVKKKGLGTWVNL